MFKKKKQPLVAPVDVKRYFLTPNEAARISLFATFFASTGSLYIPNLDKKTYVSDFVSIIKKFMYKAGYKLVLLSSEYDSKSKINKYLKEKKWPCYAFYSDTSGEKKEEIFVGKNEILFKTNFKNLKKVSIKKVNDKSLNEFINNIQKFKTKNTWTKDKLKKIFEDLLKNFHHYNLEKDLDSKM